MVPIQRIQMRHGLERAMGIVGVARERAMGIVGVAVGGLSHRGGVQAVAVRRVGVTAVPASRVGRVNQRQDVSDLVVAPLSGVVAQSRSIPGQRLGRIEALGFRFRGRPVAHMLAARCLGQAVEPSSTIVSFRLLCNTACSRLHIKVNFHKCEGNNRMLFCICF